MFSPADWVLTQVAHEVEGWMGLNELNGLRSLACFRITCRRLAGTEWTELEEIVWADASRVIAEPRIALVSPHVDILRARHADLVYRCEDAERILDMFWEEMILGPSNRGWAMDEGWDDSD